MNVSTRELFRLWKEKELREGRTISERQLAAESGVTRPTIKKLLKNSNVTIDKEVAAKLCVYFGIEPGQPVPFITFEE